MRIPELLAEIRAAAQLRGVRDVELPALLEVGRESNPEQALFVEFPLQGRQLLLDIQKITVDELAVGVQDLDASRSARR